MTATSFSSQSIHCTVTFQISGQWCLKHFTRNSVAQCSQYKWNGPHSVQQLYHLFHKYSKEHPEEDIVSLHSSCNNAPTNTSWWWVWPWHCNWDQWGWEWESSNVNISEVKDCFAVDSENTKTFHTRRKQRAADKWEKLRVPEPVLLWDASL